MMWGNPLFMVGQVGFEPTVYLTSRFYGPLQSLAMCTDPYGDASGARTRNFQLERLVSEPIRRWHHMETPAGLEPGIAAVKGLCPYRLDEWALWQGGVLPAHQATAYFAITRISSICTPNKAANTTRLPTVGSAVPFCHL